MFKRTTVLTTLFALLLTSFVLADVTPTGAAGTSLPAPQSVSVTTDSSNFIIKWQNPAGVETLARSSYDNYEGIVNYIIDWRVNNGAWHYDREIPADREILDCYPDISMQFAGMVYDAGLSGQMISRTTIDKVQVGVPYAQTIPDWLKGNCVEFRVRYIYGYWDDNEECIINQHSSFSNVVALGSVNSAGNSAEKPQIGDYGLPQAPSSLEAPQNLVSVPMTLNLGWKVPESIKTLKDMELYPTYAFVDWKLNNGQWHDGFKAFTDSGDVSFSRPIEDLTLDKDDCVRIYLDRGPLGIPDGIALATWLQDKTYSFRVRYVTMLPAENGEIKYVVSSYSNTASLGAGSSAVTNTAVPAPAGQDSSSYKNASSWAVPELNRAVPLGLVTDRIKGNMQQNITREEFAEVAFKLYEELTGDSGDTTDNPFTDTQNPAVIRAAGLGIVAGMGQGKFAPQVLISREQLGVMLHRLIVLSKPEAAASSSGIAQFKDAHQISPYAKEAMGFIASQGIIKGSDGCINPQEKASREQAVMMALRIYDQFNK